MNNIPQAVLLLIIANVLFSYLGFKDNSFFNKYKFQVGPIRRGEQIRMLTSGFLHADYVHLGLNMYVLYVFAKVVILYLGVPYFIAIYFGSLITGSLYSLYRHKDNSMYSAVGASGAVSGIVYASILLRPEMKLMMLPIPIEMPAYVFGIGYLVYSIYGMQKQLGNIGHSAHLGGAIGGFLLTLVIKPSIITANPMIIGLLAVPIVALLFFEKQLRLK